MPALFDVDWKWFLWPLSIRIPIFQNADALRLACFAMGRGARRQEKSPPKASASITSNCQRSRRCIGRLRGLSFARQEPDPLLQML